VDTCRDLLARGGDRILLPTDVVVADKVDADARTATVDADAIPADKLGLDIGPRSAAAFADALGPARTVFWNGPMGVFELAPFAAIRSVQTLVDGDKLLIGYGAQDLSPHQSGAYTGDVSGPMLAKLGCRYVVVGHSERRAYHHEDDAVVNAKVNAALRNEI